MQYGGDYNPEQWSEETWVEDARLMREAGVTLVTVNVFSWSVIQPAEGVFEWEWLDRVLENMHANGIDVDLATGTASPPPWLTEQYPGVLPQDENGVNLWPGSRQHYSPTSPDYRRLAATLVSALVERYARHPAVSMWHVNNELGCHVAYDYSDNARAAFAEWLEQKYTTIKALNTAWNTAFWSQRYTSFAQIIPPRKTPSFPNPGLVLDFKRFSSDALLDLFVMERDIVRASGATQPITTNLMGAFPGADYWSWAEEMDVVSNDAYPDPNDPEAFRSMAFSSDVMRGLKPDRPWLLMEQATNAVQWRPTNARKQPGVMSAWSMQSVSRGADGILFFQWRQSRAGAEKFHSAMLPHSGEKSRVFREISALGADLKVLPQMGTGSRARVGIVFDWDCLWAVEGPAMPVTLDYHAIVQRWHAALHRQHIGVDIVSARSDLSSYALVIAPLLYLVTDESAANLSNYVENGGHLLVSAFTDVVDETNTFRAGGYLQALGAVFGVAVEEYDALVLPGTGGPGYREASFTVDGTSIRGEYMVDELHPETAEVVAVFSDGPIKGSPALTANGFGSGVGYYIATIPDDAGMTSILAWAAERAGVGPELTGLPEVVEVSRRDEHLLLINHGSEAVSLIIPADASEAGKKEERLELSFQGWTWLHRP
ncbi:beta-galactosidase [Agreia sp. Leaf283]|uniref:beta-galactosidase n=1 Tax=Agreia sp. Leaf283 TaxID=1736321 RepID=UPI0006F5B066|nr:beta-galactosidase [Agreia sp. Leaf283]KQP56010.1 hypothetical protein ASF51_12850 [Agreia sp. Leaf283]